jgi:hypothetical protein
MMVVAVPQVRTLCVRHSCQIFIKCWGYIVPAMVFSSHVHLKNVSNVQRGNETHCQGLGSKLPSKNEIAAFGPCIGIVYVFARHWWSFAPKTCFRPSVPVERCEISDSVVRDCHFREELYFAVRRRPQGSTCGPVVESRIRRGTTRASSDR